VTSASGVVAIAELALPLAIVSLRTAYSSESGPALVGALKNMAVTELLFALLFAAGVLA
jgi:1,4-dihydroxy-2-naphthoate octaprenyltransferase